jgi:CDP-paratose 2-epimerase
MKLLITGGCGFLGSNLAAEALTRGYDVTIYDDLRRVGSRENLEWLNSLGKFSFLEKDIRDVDAITNSIKEIKPDVIFHLAGQVAMTTSINDPRLDLEINVLGSFNVMEAVRKYSPYSQIIYSSTNKVYGDLEYLKYEELESRYNCLSFKNGLPETVSLEFSSPYGCSKGAADQYFLDANRIFGTQTVVFRHSSMYGGRQFATYDQGWVGWFVKQALDIKNNPDVTFEISGNGKQVRDLLHAKDMINLYFSTLENFSKVSGKAFNIGGGLNNSLSLLELFSELEKLLNIKMNYKKLPVRSSDQKFFVADLTKINSLIGWSPKVSYQDGLRDMVNWVGSIK